MYGINLKVFVAMVTELCTHFISAMACTAMLLRFSSCIPLLILKSQRHKQIIFLKSFNSTLYFRNRSALAVNCRVIIHCLEVSCKGDQITSAKHQ